MKANLTIGILALQGAIEPHIATLDKLNIKGLRVNSISDLTKVSALILPGGESTTMLKLIDSKQLFEPLKKFCSLYPCWGVCAGAILMAHQVENPTQPSLDLLPIKASRNAYGSQIDSFKGEVKINLSDHDTTIKADFIRAPKISAINQLNTNTNQPVPFAWYEGVPVGFKFKNRLATAFHTELGSSTLIHQILTELII